jgi:RNA polymerase subunit RPABC4/transcription elongation factor Spt4
MEKDARRERSIEFAWSSGISCCDNFKSTAETPFQIWSQWVKNLTKCGLGRSQVRAIIPRFGDVSADIAQPPGCRRCGVTYVTASPAWMKLAQIVIHPSKSETAMRHPLQTARKLATALSLILIMAVPASAASGGPKQGGPCCTGPQKSSAAQPVRHPPPPAEPCCTNPHRK